MKWEYMGFTRDGRQVSGTLTAVSRKNALEILERKGVIALHIDNTEQSVQRAKQVTGRLKEVSREIVKKFVLKGRPLEKQRLSLSTLTILFRILALLSKSGLPFVKALLTVANQFGNAPAGLMLMAVAANIEKGRTVSKALAEFPGAFSQYTLSLLEVGETAGTLDAALERIANLYESRLSFTMRFQAALVYPLFVLGISIPIFIIMLHFAIPIFSRILQSLNTPLPALSRVVLNLISIIGTSYFPLVFSLLVILLFVSARRYFSFSENRKILENCLLHIPKFRRYFFALMAARFCRTLLELYGGGIGLLSSLRHLAMTMGSLLMKEEIENIALKLSKGSALSQAVKECSFFPPLVGSIIATWETTGQLEVILSKGTAYFEQEVAYTIEQVQTLIEPLILLLMGAMVGLFVLVIITPLFSAIGAIGG